MSAPWGTAVVRLERLEADGPGAPGGRPPRFLLRVQVALEPGADWVVGPRVTDADEARAAVAGVVDALLTALARPSPDDDAAQS